MAGTSTHLDVLLVEDNPGDAKLVARYIDSTAVGQFVEDPALDHVESLTGAESALQDAEYDLVLLDLGLPESSGLETLSTATEFVEDTPIIVLTGMRDRDSAIEAIERGAQDYLPKSELDGDRLARALRYAVVRSRQQRELQRRTDQLEFFNNILQHDILNGMNVIRARGEFLTAELEGDQLEYATTVVDWSDDLIDLTQTVQSVLDTLSEGGLTDAEPRDVEGVVEGAADRARSMADGVTVTIDVPDRTVVADDLLDDVFGNLLTNAVEHGGDDVSVTVTGTADAHSVTVRVADDGPGIPPADRRRVFQRGEKGEDSSGTGFGLYFVDSMVDAYGGDVWIEESDRGGAEFVVELPLKYNP